MNQYKFDAPRTVILSRVFSKWTGRRRLSFSTSSQKPRWPSANARSSGISSAGRTAPGFGAEVSDTGGPVRASSIGREAW